MYVRSASASLARADREKGPYAPASYHSRQHKFAPQSTWEAELAVMIAMIKEAIFCTNIDHDLGVEPKLMGGRSLIATGQPPTTVAGDRPPPSAEPPDPCC